MKTKEIHFFMGGAGPTYTLQIFDLDLRLANLGSHTEEWKNLSVKLTDCQLVKLADKNVIVVFTDESAVGTSKTTGADALISEMAVMVFQLHLQVVLTDVDGE